MHNGVQQDPGFTSSPLAVMAGYGENISQWTNEKQNGSLANMGPSEAMGFTEYRGKLTSSDSIDQDIEIQQGELLYSTSKLLAFKLMSFIVDNIFSDRSTPE